MVSYESVRGLLEPAGASSASGASGAFVRSVMCESSAGPGREGDALFGNCRRSLGAKQP